jgi:pimeloyl-ACP methyl ester carboxylesterase
MSVSVDSLFYIPDNGNSSYLSEFNDLLPASNISLLSQNMVAGRVSPPIESLSSSNVAASVGDNPVKNWINKHVLTDNNLRGLFYKPTGPDAPTQKVFPQAVQVEFVTQEARPHNLNGWWVKPTRENAPVFLFNRGIFNPLQDRLPTFEKLIEDGSGLLAFNWRGYGGTDGKPDEAGLHEDAAAAYDYLKTKNLPNPIVIYGESLGAAMAIKLAARLGSSGADAIAPSLTAAWHALVVDSGFEKTVASLRYAKHPLALMIPDRLKDKFPDKFDSKEVIKTVKMPVLIASTPSDTVVNPQDAKVLRENATSSSLVEVKSYKGPHATFIAEFDNLVGRGTRLIFSKGGSSGINDLHSFLDNVVQGKQIENANNSES